MEDLLDTGRTLTRVVGAETGKQCYSYTRATLCSKSEDIWQKNISKPLAATAPPYPSIDWGSMHFYAQTPQISTFFFLKPILIKIWSNKSQNTNIFLL